METVKFYTSIWNSRATELEDYADALNQAAVNQGFRQMGIIGEYQSRISSIDESVGDYLVAQYVTDVLLALVMKSVASRYTIYDPNVDAAILYYTADRESLFTLDAQSDESTAYGAFQLLAANREAIEEQFGVAYGDDWISQATVAQLLYGDIYRQISADPKNKFFPIFDNLPLDYTLNTMWRYVGGFGQYMFHPHAVGRLQRMYSEIKSVRFHNFVYHMSLIEPMPLEELVETFDGFSFASLIDSAIDVVSWIVPLPQNDLVRKEVPNG